MTVGPPPSSAAAAVLLLPLLVPLGSALLALLAGRRRRLRSTVGALGMAALLASAIAVLWLVHRDGPLSYAVGGWAAPLGITLYADHLAGLMLVLTGLVGLSASVYAAADLDASEPASDLQHPLMLLVALGVSGAFLAGDLFNLYVWFEVFLIGSFVLLASGREGLEAEAAFKYLVLNLVGSLLLLLGVGLVYGLTGTLDLALATEALARHPQTSEVTATSVLFLAAFGLKAAVFPVFFWLPAAYHTAPIAVTAFLSGLLTKVGVYALLRTFTALFVAEPGVTHLALLWVASLTMAVGVLGALAQTDVRRLLAFHVISQVGYMVLGLALLTPLGLLAAIFFLAHNVVAKTALFLVGGLVARLTGSYDLGRIRDVVGTRPGLAVLFLVPALALAGIPPLSGFWGKLLIARAGLEADRPVAVAAALAVGLLTLTSMAKIWFTSHLPPADPELPPPPPARPLSAALVLPALLLAGLTVAIGLFAAPLYDVADAASRELLAPRGSLGPP